MVCSKTHSILKTWECITPSSRGAPVKVVFLLWNLSLFTSHTLLDILLSSKLKSIKTLNFDPHGRCRVILIISTCFLATIVLSYRKFPVKFSLNLHFLKKNWEIVNLAKMYMSNRIWSKSEAKVGRSWLLCISKSMRYNKTCL